MEALSVQYETCTAQTLHLRIGLYPYIAINPGTFLVLVDLCIMQMMLWNVRRDRGWAARTGL